MLNLFKKIKKPFSVESNYDNKIKAYNESVDEKDQIHFSRGYKHTHERKFLIKLIDNLEYNKNSINLKEPSMKTSYIGQIADAINFHTLDERPLIVFDVVIPYNIMSEQTAGGFMDFSKDEYCVYRENNIKEVATVKNEWLILDDRTLSSINKSNRERAEESSEKLITVCKKLYPNHL